MTHHIHVVTDLKTGKSHLSDRNNKQWARSQLASTHREWKTLKKIKP